MPKKKKTTSKAMVSWQEKLMAKAEQEKARKTTVGSGGDSIKLSKGKFKFKGEDLGDTLPVVILDFVKTKNYFDRPYDEENPSPPVCFSLSADGNNMSPHETAPEPQESSCADCWANEFESDARGKGKACRDSYLVALVHADDRDQADPQVAYLRVPPTSLSAFDSYLRKRVEVLGLPAVAFITEIWFDDSVDYQKLLFQEVGRTEEEYYPNLLPLMENQLPILMNPPDVSGYDKATTKKKTKKKVAKKKVAKKKSRSRFA